MAAVERVFALHDFDAENPDEVSFKAGEPVIIVERDDAYGDGWWQGTNTRGETGLFPFSYTTFDAELAKGAAVGGGKSVPETGSNGKVMNSTMADIDEALAGLRTGNGTKTGVKGADIDRRSLNSERTGDYSVGNETDENGNAEDDLESRARARAALAVNAARDQESVDDAERAEQARMKAQALKTFEEEEEKQRQLLLKREEERKIAASKGTLTEDEKPKVAPIPGLDMSDESDSEGSEVGDFDDVAAPTHAPLFGGPIASPGSNSLGASDAVRSAGTLKSPNDLTPIAGDQQQGRNLSPIPSLSAHDQGGQTALFAGASAAAAAGLGAAALTPPGGFVTDQASVSPDLAVSPNQPEQSNSYDRGSIISSKGRNSMNANSPNAAFNNVGATNNGVSGLPTSASYAGSDAGRGMSQTSPSPSITGRAAGPGGDPHDWTVDQVVEWARSKGWDENQVVSKFAEHEISGDVLMEMDVNILKEIDINAFGKRFQVANAIKEMKKSLHGGDVSSTSWSAIPDSGPSPNMGAPPQSFQIQQQRNLVNSSDPPSSQGHQFGVPAAIGLGAAGAGMATGAHLYSAQAPPTSQFDITQPSMEQRREVSAGGWTQSPMTGSLDREVMSDGDVTRSSAATSETKATSVPKRNFSQDEASYNSNAPASPRKRESIGSANGKTSGDRTSFFATFQSNKGRKPAPRVQSPGVAENERGTFSRLGFSRLKAGAAAAAAPSEAGANNQDIRNRISLPTSSPTYDAMGDTARRNRISQQSNGSGKGQGINRANIDTMGMGARQKQASVGSAADFYTAPSQVDGASSEGAVMARIRPVDQEGWMRKKGERYNTWKPRYLALKGSDLVLLRDPSAAKIKGYVSMKGYKVIADENTNPGKYGFKILHEREKPHYFSSDDAIVVREWMKALMKATIDRDTSLPVISSYNNATISLKEAQKMNPPPRPPSPTSVARAQRARARGNKDELSAKDASVLMGVQQSGDNGRLRGFIAQDEVSPVYRQSQDTHREVDYKSHRRLQDCTSPVDQVAPWLLREGADGYLPEAIRPARSYDRLENLQSGNVNIPSSSNTFKRVAPVAPLNTHGLIPKQGSLPTLATPDQEIGVNMDHYTEANFSSSIPPTPLPKSGQSSNQSDTMGCADLPPPPPPSHSPDHKYRIQSFIRKRTAKPWPTTLPLPPTPHGTPPSPISKGSSNASSYPTVSDSAAAFGSSRLKQMTPSPLSTQATFKKVGKKMLNTRPRSAGDGVSRGSIRSPLSVGVPSSVGGGGAAAAKNSFIVFSANRGTTLLQPRASGMMQGEAARQQQITISPSDYSNSDSVFSGSAPLQGGQEFESPGFRGSLSTYLDMIPKTAALPLTMKQIKKADHRRSSSFEGFQRPKKENLRQETMNKPSWFKMNRDREKRKQTEMESEEKIAEAEREIHENNDDSESEVAYLMGDDDDDDDVHDKYSHGDTPNSQKDGMEEIDAYVGKQDWHNSSGALSSPTSGQCHRRRCLSDQPYPGLITLSPSVISSPRSSPHSPF